MKIINPNRYLHRNLQREIIYESKYREYLPLLPQCPKKSIIIFAANLEEGKKFQLYLSQRLPEWEIRVLRQLERTIRGV